ncbi:MAG: acyl-CoA/acyl-ACP dehydrogenase [Rhodospirillaceae bacterium]|jgi:acyl-CoA dehydrogenase|nr:acyl-CoA/acyl-ACP dehydrogenase [Rhodospirillaceae bacterium]MBT5810959.1 acyl-CoA/acyl-ACP dehydrogenase [Rhodospirillaceae bacterium]
MNELQQMLNDTVTRLFGDLVTKDALQDAETWDESAAVWPEELWRAVEENGLAQPVTPEIMGGVGANWADSYVIARAAGYYAAPIPLVETILGGWLLSQCGLMPPEGPLTVAPVRAGESLTLGEGGLSGAVTAVPWGRRAGHVVVVANGAAGPRIALVEGASATVKEDCNMAREARDTLVFDNAPVLESAPLVEALGDDPIHLYGAMLRAAQTAGGVQRVLEDTVQYAKDRIQFGRPIAKFQIIQQNLATVGSQTAAAGAAAQSAFRSADRGDPRFEVAAAKIVTGDAATTAASIVHQTHGAIGFTYEHTLHFSTRRLWSWRSEFGGEAHWAEMLGRSVARRGADALWPDLTARQAGL